MPVGQPGHHHRRGVLGNQGGDPDRGQVPRPAGHARREPERRAHPEPQPERGHQRGQHQRGDAHRGPDRQRELGGCRQAGEVGGVRAAERHKRDVGGDDHDAGQHGRERGAGELPVRLQDAVEHHGQAVQQDLRGEHLEHAGSDRDGLRPGAALQMRDEQRGHGLGHQAEDHAGRDQQHDRPGQQRGRDLAGGARRLRVGAGPLRGRAGQDRHHDAGQRTAEHDVVDDVRHLVGGGVGGAEAGVLHRMREHELAAEPDDPRRRGERADEEGGAADAAADLVTQRAARLRVLLGHRGGGPGHWGAAAAGADTGAWCASLTSPVPSVPCVPLASGDFPAPG